MVGRIANIEADTTNAEPHTKGAKEARDRVGRTVGCTADESQRREITGNALQIYGWRSGNMVIFRWEGQKLSRRPYDTCFTIESDVRDRLVLRLRIRVRFPSAL